MITLPSNFTQQSIVIQLNSLQFLPLNRRILHVAIFSSFLQLTICHYLDFRVYFRCYTHSELSTPPLMACPSISVRTFGLSIFTCGNSGNSTSRLSPNEKACDIYSLKNSINYLWATDLRRKTFNNITCLWGWPQHSIQRLHYVSDSKCRQIVGTSIQVSPRFLPSGHQFLPIYFPVSWTSGRGRRCESRKYPQQGSSLSPTYPSSKDQTR